MGGFRNTDNVAEDVAQCDDSKQATFLSASPFFLLNNSNEQGKTR